MEKIASSVSSRFLTAMRYTPSREFYIPKGKGVDIETPRGTDLVIYKWIEKSGQVMGMGFAGKQNKPFFNYIFRNEDQRNKYIEDTVKSRRNLLDSKAEEQKKRKEYEHGLKVDDVLYSSWGYDQTNVDFYQVVAATDKGVKIRKIGKKVVKSEVGSDYVVAIPGRFTGPPMNKRVNTSDSVMINSFASASKWDGKPKYETAFGYGH